MGAGPGRSYNREMPALPTDASNTRKILFIQDSSSVGSASSVVLTARGETPAAFGQRCIPPPPQRAGKRALGAPGSGCVAPRSNTHSILARRALPDGRLAGLGATLDFHHGLLDAQPEITRCDGLARFCTGQTVRMITCPIRQRTTCSSPCCSSPRPSRWPSASRSGSWSLRGLQPPSG
jgi:hypothetical protein